MEPHRGLVCIIGWPVAQSLSPAIHNAAFAACDLDWSYVRLAVRPAAIGGGVGLMRALALDGANVTMPHKETIIEHLDGCAPSAEAVGAVNTIVRDGSRLIGHNTDGDGFIQFLRSDAGFGVGGDGLPARALVLGAGGAARAVAVALAGAGTRVLVAARRASQADAVAALASGIEAVAWAHHDADLVINATPKRADLVVNATPERADLPVRFAPGQVAVDLITAAPETPFVLNARAAGARAFDGIGMLVHQAALSFTLWTGREAPIDIMAAAARAATATAPPA